jgi:DNA polymerase-3 subunit epsilon
MIVMGYDTETQSFPLYKEPSEHPDQPHIVELAAILMDDATRTELKRMHRIVRPDGWVSSPEALAVHGITHERAMDEGVPERQVMEEFHALQLQADLRIGHNESFDQRIMRIGYKRHTIGFNSSAMPEQEYRDEIADAFKARLSYCTKNGSRKDYNLPPTPAMLKKNMRFPKDPKLSEAYMHYFNTEMQGAHSALHDTQNTLRVYYAITQGVRDPNAVTFAAA